MTDPAQMVETVADNVCDWFWLRRRGHSLSSWSILEQNTAFMGLLRGRWQSETRTCGGRGTQSRM